MDPQDDPAFPIPTWQSTLDLIKESATARIVELKNQHDGDEDATFKILVCENGIKVCLHICRSSSYEDLGMYLGTWVRGAN